MSAQSMIMLEFDAFDNPMQLSKVGNWVFTFLNQPERVEDTQLALTCVIPRQAEQSLQLRRLVLQHGKTAQLWQVVQIECFDGSQELTFAGHAPVIQPLLQQLLVEFKKYDVEVKCHYTAEHVTTT